MEKPNPLKRPVEVEVLEDEYWPYDDRDATEVANFAVVGNLGDGNRRLLSQTRGMLET